MRHVNLATVDLNLLKTFIAIWETKSLTIAADQLNLSQPAVSHALRRLREVFNDQLFVRSGSGMLPTPAAVNLHPPIDQALTVIRKALQRHGSFDAQQSDRVFKLAMSDMAALHVMPTLVADLACCAPGVSIETRSVPVHELDVSLRSGDIEIAIGYLPGLSDECHTQELMADRFVCLLSAHHPLAEQVLTVEMLSNLQFVHTETNVTGHGLAERSLRSAGVHRQISVRVAQFNVAPHIVAKTELALILPETIARTYCKLGDLVVKDLPCAMPPLFVKIYTHPKFDGDSGIVWIKDKLMELFGESALNSSSRLAEPARANLLNRSYALN